MSFRISDFGFRIFVAIAIAMLLPYGSFGAEKKKRGGHSAPSFIATVNDHTISVKFVFGKFDPKKRVVTKRNAKTDASEPYEQILLNGKPILGTDNSDPTPGFGESKPFETIERILLRWDGKQVEIPQSLFDHIVLPHENTNLSEGSQPNAMFIPDPSGVAMVIVMTVGDGGGTNRIVWLFRKDGKHRILPSSFLDLSN